VAVGAVLSDVGAVAGRPGKIVGALIGHYVGAFAGEAAGFYVDNLTRIEENINTFLNEANQSREWIMPDPSDQ
jgi:hypothetical protein